ncbi:phage tail assembly chaperone [Clostridium perfringens]|uniref:phage tail assembly chaperone n=1 Tax=Clostridium perfringens TaxID=1502 RepID=UPI000D710FA5|nr:XkdN-like protein [Clostridium perfringens]MDK0979349.1 phage portal protein [Clostridium perfringens]MDT9337329.1 phage portal protein [Clostridium perfringens]MDT9345085.1 phage portal protein [Clostridium perfringens]MDT9348171.1 phage portal protein [Clostridium perfringens]MDT9354172.1 phage portal protein [Clostridium perfringens]
MSKLTEFLLNNTVENLTEEVIVSDRFKVDGEILKFKIKAVNPDEFSDLQKQCTKVGKKGKVNFDSKMFNEQLIINYTVDPNFKDAEVVKKAGCMTPEQLVNKVLLAGEVATLVEEISALSGFDKDLEELREEAKN